MGRSGLGYIQQQRVIGGRGLRGGVGEIDGGDDGAAPAAFAVGDGLEVVRAAVIRAGDVVVLRDVETGDVADCDVGEGGDGRVEG